MGVNFLAMYVRAAEKRNERKKERSKEEEEKETGSGICEWLNGNSGILVVFELGF